MQPAGQYLIWETKDGAEGDVNGIHAALTCASGLALAVYRYGESRRLRIGALIGNDEEYCRLASAIRSHGLRIKCILFPSRHRSHAGRMSA